MTWKLAYQPHPQQPQHETSSAGAAPGSETNTTAGGAPRGIRRYLVAPFIVLVLATLVFRAIGVLGLPLSWHDATRLALALMFCFTGFAHFGPMKEGLLRMVPRRMPYPRLMVAMTGALEFLGAVGLVIPATASLAGYCLAALLLAMFPANVNAAQRSVSLGRKPATPLWFRTLIQVVFIAALLWATR